MRDAEGDDETLVVTLLLFAVSFRLATETTGGGGGGSIPADSRARKAGEVPPAAATLAPEGRRMPTRKFHDGRLSCDLASETGSVQMRNTTSARCRVNVTGGTRSRSAAFDTLRQHETVMLTLDVAGETSDVPRRTSLKATTVPPP